MIDLPFIMLIFLGLLVLRVVVLPWGPSTRLHDPISALVASLADALPALGATAAATAPEAAAAATDAAITLPEVAVTAAAPAAAAGTGLAAGDALASLAPLAAGGALAATDAAGAGAATLPPLTTPSLPSTMPASAAPLATLPSTSPATAATAAGGPSASSVSVPAPGGAPSAFTAGNTLPNQIGQVADAGVSDTVSGPAAGAAPVDTGALPGSPGTTPATGAFGTPASAGFTDAGIQNSWDTLAASPAPASPAAASNSADLLAKIPGGQSVENFVGANKGLLTLGSAALPLAALLFQNNNIPGLTNAEQLAAGEGNTAAALQAASTNGVLPAGYEDALQRAQTTAAAGIRSNYAEKGLSGSTTEAEDIAASNQTIEAQRAALLSDLTKQGLTAAGQAGSLDTSIANIELSQDQQLQNALSRLSTNLVLASLPARLAA